MGTAEANVKKLLIVAASLTLLSLPAFAQGGSPYNSSGSQAGGPRGGQERALGAGARVGGPRVGMARPMRHHRMRHHRRHRR